MVLLSVSLWHLPGSEIDCVLCAQVSHPGLGTGAEEGSIWPGACLPGVSLPSPWKQPHRGPRTTTTQEGNLNCIPYSCYKFLTSITLLISGPSRGSWYQLVSSVAGSQSHRPCCLGSECLPPQGSEAGLSDLALAPDVWWWWGEPA